MEVIVKSSPKIEIELATKVVKVGEGSRVDIDSALSTTSENPVQNKVITSELSSLGESVVSLEVKKADKDGVYSGMTVGTADDLAGRGESVPAEFGFRASGGKSIKDGRAYIKRIKGNSVVWNQLFERGAIRSDAGAQQYYDEATGEMVINGTITTGTQYAGSTAYGGVYSELVVGHKYLTIIRKISGTYSGTTSYIYLGGSGRLNLYTETTEQIGFWEAKSNFYPYSVITFQVGDIFDNLRYTIRNYDLTQMFGAGNEPTTIEEFNARVATLGVDMNAYNEGEVIHCNTESIKSVGDNAWDEEWEEGGLSANGLPVEATNRIRSKNYIPVVPHKAYYASKALVVFYYDINYNIISYEAIAAGVPPIPSNCYYLKFYEYGTTTYNHDIMISLVHSGWKQDTDAGYQPYWQDTLPLPIIRKYFPDGMKSAGTAHDEIRYNKASGKWEAVKRIGVVDMGTLEWNYESNLKRFSSSILPSSAKQYGVKGNTLSAYGYYDSTAPVAPKEENLALGVYNNKIFLFNTAYTDAASFKAAMQGVLLYYELAEHIVTELDEADQNFRDYYNVADFGTEQAIAEQPSAPISADIIYQFNAVDMIREHELEITELQNIIATMQAQLTSLINGGQ